MENWCKNQVYNWYDEPYIYDKNELFLCITLSSFSHQKTNLLHEKYQLALYIYVKIKTRFNLEIFYQVKKL